MRALPEQEHAAIPGAAPERGPRILFFSGGTALRSLCRDLKRATHNSIHVITPFDSGGSSGPLRQAFAMPGVGDLRNRLVSLAQEDVAGSVESARLVSHRLSSRSQEAGRRQLDAMIAGRDALVAEAPSALSAFARAQLGEFALHVTPAFDLRGASVGNLILTGAWLEKADLAAAITALSELLGVRGTIHPTVDANLHLAARLEDGSRIVGQHRITGKQHPPLPSPVREIELVDSSPAAEPVEIAAPDEVLAAIGTADLICFPMGSFFSSVLCNLLPRGVGRAVAEANCPKLYVPNTGEDPEMQGIDPAGATALLIDALRRDAGENVPTERLLDFVLLTEDAAGYALPPDLRAIRELGPEPLEKLTPPQTGDARDIDSEQLAEILVSLAT